MESIGLGDSDVEAGGDRRERDRASRTGWNSVLLIQT